MIDSHTAVTLLQAGPSVATDRYGRPMPGPDIRTVIRNCTVFQTATAEVPQVGGDQAVTNLTVLVPYSTQVGYLDRLVFGAVPTPPAEDDPPEVVYQVLGSPTRYQNPFTGHRAGGVVYVRLVEG